MICVEEGLIKLPITGVLGDQLRYPKSFRCFYGKIGNFWVLETAVARRFGLLISLRPTVDAA